MTNPDKFCPAPFVQATCRTNGTLNPCCYYHTPPEKLNIKRTSISQEWNSASMHDLRMTMLDSTKTDAQCKAGCYDREAQGLTSERLSWLHRFGFINSPDYKQVLESKGWNNLEFPKRVELHVGNLCNLKCLTCGISDSSSFLTESKMILQQNPGKTLVNVNPADLVQSKWQYTDEQLSSLIDEILSHDIEVLDLRGGETMMIPFIGRKLLNLSPERKEKIQIRVQTNGTVLNDQWKQILQSFHKVSVQVSIDAIGQDLTYIRYPSDWNVVQQNLNWIRQLPNVDLTVACVVSNLNLPVLTKFMQWADHEALNWGLSLVEAYKIYVANNLPATLFYRYIEQIKSYNLIKKEGNQPILQYLCSLTPLDDRKLWQQFCNNISLRDSHRKNSIFSIEPELKDYWLH